MSAIEEYRAGQQPVERDAVVGRDRPLVIRGLCRDWRIVGVARESDTAFAKGLAAFDNGADPDVLLVPAEEGGVVRYNAAFDGCN